MCSSDLARQAKSKARISAYEEMLQDEPEERRSRAELIIPPGPRLGNLVIEASHMRKAFGDKLLFDDLSFNLPRGGIVGVIGPNGAGKTTLFRIITGQEKVDGGEFRVGDTVKLGYVDQSRDSLPGDKSVYEVISNGRDVIKVGGREINFRAYCGAFGFRGQEQQQKCGTLSGGEIGRAHV
mgnify:FL=1